ncbi:MAG: OmpA family protein [Paludibacter sp.]
MQQKGTLFLLLVFVFLYIQYSESAERHLNVYFDTNKYKLSKVDQNYITREIDSLSKLNIFKIEIIGHTDNAADSLFNIKLSNLRANEVKSYLKSLGFNENILSIGYYGENKPVTKNDSEEAKRKNRRAQIIIQYSNNQIQKPDSCIQKDTIIRTRYGKELVFNGCEFQDIQNCLEIIDNNSHSDLKKGIVVMSKNGQDLLNYGSLYVNLLDGCVKNECFKNPVIVRFPIRNTPTSQLSWALIKGEKTTLRLVKINDKLFYELELKCPTSWINCNCKKNQKH